MLAAGLFESRLTQYGGRHDSHKCKRHNRTTKAETQQQNYDKTMTKAETQQQKQQHNDESGNITKGKA